MAFFSRSHLAIVPLLALSLAACDKAPPKAVVEEAKPAPAAPAAAEAKKEEPKKEVVLETLNFSQETSKIEWVGAKVTLKHDGGFKTFTGKVELADGALEGGKVSVEIETKSVFSDAEKLTGHLLSPDFFDVEKFPKAEFASTEIKTGGAEGATHTITGNLTLHGVTKSVSFPAKVEVSDSEVKATAEFSINRKDFDIVYPGKPDDLIHDNVTIKLDIKAPREATKPAAAEAEKPAAEAEKAAEEKPAEAK